MAFQIRPATKADQQAIAAIVRSARINPADLDWQRFIVAIEGERIVGTAQIKHHSDGSRELASLAVVPERRGQGIGTAIVKVLIAQQSAPLYLVCADRLEGFYQRFGFRTLARTEMPRYFRRVQPLFQLMVLVASLGRVRRILVMVRP